MSDGWKQAIAAAHSEDAVKAHVLNDIKPLPGTLMKLQERAYTSPIWYTPAN